MSLHLPDGTCPNSDQTVNAEQFYMQHEAPGGRFRGAPLREDIFKFAEAYAALKVREYEKGLLPRVDDTLIACNREIAKLREELAQSKQFAAQLESNIKFLNERLEKETRELREERDALKAENQLAWNTCDEAETKLSRAESALAEARAEALDDARVTVSRMVRNKLGQTDWNDVDDALVALKEKR